MAAAGASEYLTSHRAILEALPTTGEDAVLYVAGSTTRIEAIVERARRHGVTVRNVGRGELRRIAPEARDCALDAGRRPGATAATLDEVLAASDAARGLLLVLDHITDPHNYGAILRSADQFAADAVVVPGRRSAPLSAVAVQSSAGTARHVRIVTVPNLAAAVGRMQDAGFWVYAADMAGEPAHKTRLTGRTAVVLGSEGGGVSRLVAERADGLLRIPMHGHADSLNVSVACGVLLYEVRRQQGWLDSV
ncbi:MAG: 23S rRNA (guanosine(2251)-2'-O)-methyltransferase RlmB [Spirochaetota bacterium]